MTHLLKAVCRAYSPTLLLKPLQLDVLEHVINGQDVIANLPTGYGKSLIFHLLPGEYDSDYTLYIIMIIIVLIIMIDEFGA